MNRVCFHPDRVLGAAAIPFPGWNLLSFFPLRQVFIGAIAPTVFNSIYAATVHWCPPFTFYLIAGLTAVGLLITFALEFGTAGQAAGAGAAKAKVAGSGPSARLAATGDSSAAATAAAARVSWEDTPLLGALRDSLADLAATREKSHAAADS